MDNLAASIIILSLIVGATPFIVEAHSVEKNQISLNTNMTVSNQTPEQGGNLTVGIASGNNMFYGRLAPNVGSTKSVNISSGSGYTYLRINVTGNISDQMNYKEYHYFNGTKSVDIGARASEPGYYEGTVNFKTMTPRNSIGQAWLDLKSKRLLSF